MAENEVINDIVAVDGVKRVKTYKLETPVSNYMNLYSSYCKYDSKYTAVLNLFHSILVSGDIETSKDDLDGIYTELVMNNMEFNAIKRQIGLRILTENGISVDNVIIKNVFVFNDIFVFTYEVIEDAE